jgi:hypothetical protein
MESEVSIVANPVVEEHFGGTTRITWASPRQTLGMMSAYGFATVDEYCSFIGAQMYSAVLYDGALLQISYDFDGQDLIGHRLCYYPCPFDVDGELLRTEPLGDTIDMYRESTETGTNLRSPCRFDYDEKNLASDHPAVHMHVISGHCRWPVSSPLSIGHFIGFVFRHFYPQIWAVHAFLQEWPRDGAGRRTITAAEEVDIFLTCARH